MRKKTRAILFLMVVLGAILRFSFLNWDEHQSFHPDERNIAWAVTRISFFDQLNPQFFAYGGLPIYLYKALTNGVSALTHDPSWTSDWGKISVVGRFVSAFLSTLSILLIFEVGKKYFSDSIGLLSAILLSFAPWAIREAHFATTETMLVFFLLSLYLLTYRYIHTPTWKNAALIGIISGLALGAKTISVLFLIIPLTAMMLKQISLLSFPRKRESRQEHPGSPIRLASLSLRRSGSGMTFLFIKIKPIAHLTLLLLFSMLVAFTVSPYTILDFSHFKESMVYESGVALGKFTVPYTLQFLGTRPYIYQMRTMFWQMGPVAIFGLAGFIAFTIRALISLVGSRLNTEYRFMNIARYRTVLKKFKLFSIQHSLFSIQNVVFISFPLLYFLYTGSWFAKFARYNVPFLPVLTLFSAWFIYYSINLLNNKRIIIVRTICLFVYLFICLFTISWGIANWTIYTRPQTRIEASKWIYKNIPEDTLIYTEHWNDGLPISLPDVPLISYKRELLEVYLPDGDTKREMYASMLPRAAYIILSTRRIWNTMPTLGEKYPLTKRFYELLLSEKLGYREVQSFSSFPSLFGFVLSDRPAEESIEVFDHPEVKIFQNTGKFTKQQMQTLLQ